MPLPAAIRLTAWLAAGGADTDTQQVSAFTAAGKFPGAIDLPTALYSFGGLQREQATGKHQVGDLCVDFGEGFFWQRGEIHAGAAKAGDPARRAVGFGDAFNHLEKTCRHQGVTAKAFRCRCTVNPHLFEALDHVPWYVGAGVESAKI